MTIKLSHLFISLLNRQSHFCIWHIFIHVENDHKPPDRVKIAQISKLQEVPFSALYSLSHSTLICLWFCVSPIDLKRRMFWNRGWPVETRVVSVMRRWNAQADPHEWVTMETVKKSQSNLCTHCAMCAQRTKKRSTILTRDCVFNGHALYTNIGTLLMFPLEGESSGVHRNDAI